MDNTQRLTLAGAIAAGVVRIDSSRHEKPQEVARVSLAIADEIIKQGSEEAPEKPASAKKEPAPAVPVASTKKNAS